MTLSEIHRFVNVPVYIPVTADTEGAPPGKVSLHWDILRLFAEIKAGIALAINKGARDLSSLGIDTWGVDFGLLDRDGNLTSNPYHYRDSRTDGMLEEAFRRMPRWEIYQRTGIQILQLNSLYQLLSMALSHSPALEMAQVFLTIPNLLNYWLTGNAVSEFTHTTTTQCYNPNLQGLPRTTS